MGRQSLFLTDDFALAGQAALPKGMLVGRVPLPGLPLYYAGGVLVEELELSPLLYPSHQWMGRAMLPNGIKALLVSVDCEFFAHGYFTHFADTWLLSSTQFVEVLAMKISCNQHVERNWF
jgi:hypothetical protein